jgi:hypothetical protein
LLGGQTHCRNTKTDCQPVSKSTFFHPKKTIFSSRLPFYCVEKYHISALRVGSTDPLRCLGIGSGGLATVDDGSAAEIAAILNQSGVRSGKGQRFTARYIARIQKHYVLRSRFDRLRALGLLTLDEMSQTLSVNPKTVKTWAAHGLLKAHAFTDKPECLYEPPGPDRPRKAQGTKRSLRRLVTTVIPECSKEVQCEA